MLYDELKKKRKEMREEVEKKEKEPRILYGMARPHLFYTRPLTEMYGYGVETATRVAMSSIVNVVNKIGWEKYIAGMEKIQFPWVSKRSRALKEEVKLTGDSVLDVKLHTLTWSNGCGFSAGAVYEFDENHVEEFENWCPQIAALNYMGLQNEVEELGFWCDAYDACIMADVNAAVDYNHAYCIGKGDKFCKQIVTPREDGEATIKTDRREDEKSLYEIFKEQKALKREKYNGDAPEFKVSYDKPLNQQDASEEELGKHGSETKWHIATEAVNMGGALLGWEEFINLVGEKQSYGFEKAAKDRVNEFEILGDGVKEAATSVMLGYAGLPFEHSLTKYTDEEVVGIAHTCPIAEACKEMGVDGIDLSLWCDFYKNFETHAVNPNIDITHTHCLACGDKYCRFTIKENEK